MVSLACTDSVVWEGLMKASYVLAFLFFSCHFSDTLLPYSAQHACKGKYMYNQGVTVKNKRRI